MSLLRTSAFLSYAHLDDAFKNALLGHLKPLKGQIDIWSDEQIGVGQDWEIEIRSAMDRTRMAICLVSPDFLASDFITDVELPYFVQKAEAKELVLFWVPIRASVYEFTVLAKYQAAWDPRRPIDSMERPQQDSAWVSIATKMLKSWHTAP